MKALRRFFIFCSGANVSMLKRSPSDVNKYAGIGATVFFTGVMASIAGAYAIYTIFQSVWPALFFGIIWGLMIFNLDRYLVSSLKRKGSLFKDITTALPRLALAVLIAIVIAKPLELKIFDSEIKSELIVMEQERFKVQEAKVRDRFEGDVERLKTEVHALKDEVGVKRTKRDELALLALQEADGTGGSLRRNMGPIYRAKKADANQAQLELDDVAQRNDALIALKEDKIASLEERVLSEIDGLKRSELNGFAARIDALGRLSAQSRTIMLASLFITLLFIAIECAPILVKLISARSPYDFVLNEHEHRYAMHYRERMTMRNNTVLNKLKFDSESGEFKTQLAVRAEKQLAEHAIKQEVERLKESPMSWREFLKRGHFFGWQ